MYKPSKKLNLTSRMRIYCHAVYRVFNKGMKTSEQTPTEHVLLIALLSDEYKLRPFDSEISAARPSWSDKEVSRYRSQRSAGPSYFTTTNHTENSCVFLVEETAKLGFYVVVLVGCKISVQPICGMAIEKR